MREKFPDAKNFYNLIPGAKNSQKIPAAEILRKKFLEWKILPGRTHKIKIFEIRNFRKKIDGAKKVQEKFSRTQHPTEKK